MAQAKLTTLEMVGSTAVFTLEVKIEYPEGMPDTLGCGYAGSIAEWVVRYAKAVAINEEQSWEKSDDN